MDVAVGARSAISAWGAGCFRQSMQNLTVPVRAIQQQRDEDGLSRLRAYAPGLPSFDVMEMADVGHFVMLDDPATFNQLLTECLVEILGAGPKASHNTSRNPATDKGE